MPFVYTVAGPAIATPFVSSATPNTENDCIFVKPGVRNISVLAMRVGGKASALTSLSAIAYRLKKWFTTSSAIGTGTAITAAPSDPGAQAAKMTAAGSQATVSLLTSGTGGPTYQMGCTSGAAGPGACTAVTPDAAKTLEGAANQSMDVFVSSPTASMNYEVEVDVQE